jgi:hypothetical protein
MPEKESYFERSLERDEKIREKREEEKLKWGGRFGIYRRNDKDIR